MRRQYRGNMEAIWKKKWYLSRNTSDVANTTACTAVKVPTAVLHYNTKGPAALSESLDQIRLTSYQIRRLRPS